MMKKLLYLALAAMTVVLLVSSCSSRPSPGDAAKQYMEYAAAEEYDLFLDGTYFGADMPAEEVAQTKAFWKTVMSNGSVADQKSGVASIEILSEEVAEDGQTAAVVFKRTYGNGETEEESLAMVLVDGTWMMDANQ